VITFYATPKFPSSDCSYDVTDCSYDVISKEFGLVALFASVKASSVCIHLSCLVCIQSVVHGVRSPLFCGRKWCSLLEVSITLFQPLQFFVSVRRQRIYGVMFN
jgi:hypothetical protein